MAVVSGERLNAFLSGPRWSAEQQEEADLICQEVEDSLASALYGTKITPVKWTEEAPVLASGLVALRYPVTRPLVLDGVAVAEDTPLPPPWRQFEHRLFRGVQTPGYAHGGYAAGGFYATGDLLTPGAATDHVTVTYLAGWGPRAALVLAILRKAKALFLNQHDDSMVARANDASAPSAIAPDIWTEEELAPLGVYRRLSGGA